MGFPFGWEDKGTPGEDGAGSGLRVGFKAERSSGDGFKMGGLKTWENLNCDDAHNFICEYLWIQEYLSEEGGTGTMGGENLGLEEKMSRKLEENLVVVEKLRQARALGVQPDEEED